jgi:esterase/lipase superfamily enzyme
MCFVTRYDKSGTSSSGDHAQTDTALTEFICNAAAAAAAAVAAAAPAIAANGDAHAAAAAAVPSEARVRFLNEVKAAVRASARRELVVFVHGYNVNFEACMKSAAQVWFVDDEYSSVGVCWC